jgi:PAS domain S-box-containing protein
MRALLGYEEGELRGRSVWKLMPDDTRSIVRARLKRLLAEPGALPERSGLLVAKDGRIISARISSLAVRNITGVPIFIITRALPNG